MKPEYKLGQKVWFFQSNSMKTHEGEIIGFFIQMEDEKDDSKKYFYQLEYYLEQKDGSQKMYLATITAEEINEDKETADKVFQPILKKRVAELLKEWKEKLPVIEAGLDMHQRGKKEAIAQIKRLEKIQRKLQ